MVQTVNQKRTTIAAIAAIAVMAVNPANPANPASLFFEQQVSFLFLINSEYNDKSLVYFLIKFHVK
jgi:hypothetical protein